LRGGCRHWRSVCICTNKQVFPQKQAALTGTKTRVCEPHTQHWPHPQELRRTASLKASPEGPGPVGGELDVVLGDGQAQVVKVGPVGGYG
jgi:hypothetical protein